MLRISCTEPPKFITVVECTSAPIACTTLHLTVLVLTHPEPPCVSSHGLTMVIDVSPHDSKHGCPINLYLLLMYYPFVAHYSYCMLYVGALQLNQQHLLDQLHPLVPMAPRGRSLTLSLQAVNLIGMKKACASPLPYHGICYRRHN